MSTNFKTCEHESVEWIIKKLPKFSNTIFLKKVKITVTSFDVNPDVFIIGTNLGYLYYINRRTSDIQTLILKKNKAICEIKIIQTIDLSIAAGIEDGTVFILKMSIKNEIVFNDINQFIVPVDHTAAITYMAWSKNSEKLFTGDFNGSVFCTEVNNINKTVSSYCICNTSSEIIYLSYSYKSLIVSNKNENFIYNLSTHSKIAIGTKARNPGYFGACFVDKLCKPEEVEIVIVRPDSKIWIGNLNGVIKRSILLKSETLFSTDKSISLLPCVTSQSNTDYIDKIRAGAIKYQLGLVSSISENKVLFWSKNGLVFLDISNGRIISSSCNLGVILSVSICRFNNVTEPDLTYSPLTECKNMNNHLFEIWILRKPIRDEESTLVRLSTLPLTTSKLTIDRFNYFVECPDSKYSNKSNSNIENIISSELLNTKQESITKPQEIFGTGKSHDHWIPSLDIKVPDKVQELRSNVRELSKKTKDIFKQSHEIFENTNEGVEEAIELTEEGLLIEFDKKTGDASFTSNKCDIMLDSSLEVKTDKIVSNDIVNKHTRKYVRQIQLVDCDGGVIGEDSLKQPSVIIDYTIERQTASDVIERATQMLVKEEKLLLEPDIFQISSEIEKPRNLYDELYFSTNENTLSTSSCNPTSPLLLYDHHFDILDTEGLSYESKQDTELSSNTSESIEIRNPEKKISSVFCLSDNLGSDFINDYYRPTVIIDEANEITYPSVSNLSLENSDESLKSNIALEDKPILTDEILTSSNKWISHRGPSLPVNNKITSLSINRRMIWVTDTKGSLHVGFPNFDERLSNQERNTISHIQWFQDNLLLTDKIYSSPEGVILWREKCGDISVYLGITKIWTPRVVKEKVLLKLNWEITMKGIKDIDIDNDMAVIVTKKGKLKVMNEISDRSFKESYTASITGHVTLATTFNGIIWCVTEIMDPDSKIATQHIFACLAKDDDGKLNISYWRTVPVPKDLIVEKEEHLGILGGSLAIRNIQLGANDLAWIVTFQNRCFFSKHISEENPTGDGIWYQISLNFLFQIPNPNDENVVFGHDLFSSGIQSRVEKIFGYTETRSKNNSNMTIPSILISVKGAIIGNGLVWVTCMEKNSPSILFESDKYILGHGWLDCITSAIQKKTISLPATLTWSSVTFGFKNVLWLLSNCNEIFCYWKEIRIRNVTVSTSFGKVIQIAAHDCTVLLLTIKSCILIRIGITSGNPIGTDWKEINNSWNANKEMIKHISCFENEIWLVTAENLFYNEDLRSLTCNISKKSQWRSFNLKLNDSFTNPFSVIQVTSINPTRRYIWSCSDPDGHVYLGILNNSTISFEWTYIPSPRAKSVHVSNENVWMIEQSSGEIFVRCGINWECNATGDYWTHVPISTIPVSSLSVSANNEVVVIDSKQRLLSHFWTVINSIVIEEAGLSEARKNYDQIRKNVILEETLSLDDIHRYKSIDGDWELLN